MIQTDLAPGRAHGPDLLDPEDLRNAMMQTLLRSGVRFDPAPAWQFFDAHNAGALIERYRREFSTLLGLMAEWRFEQRVLDHMLNGLPLEAALRQAQHELEQQALKRAAGYVDLMRRKAARA